MIFHICRFFCTSFQHLVRKKAKRSFSTKKSTFPFFAPKVLIFSQLRHFLHTRILPLFFRASVFVFNAKLFQATVIFSLFSVFFWQALPSPCPFLTGQILRHYSYFLRSFAIYVTILRLRLHFFCSLLFLRGFRSE